MGEIEAMSVYMLFIRDKPPHDLQELEIYSRLNRERAGEFNLKPLVIYGAIEAVEGEPPDGMVLLEFENEEQARAWYRSPAYQNALPHRLRGADYRVMIVQGL
jgi:uncharacterized protein (DUF1330 family)